MKLLEHLKEFWRRLFWRQVPNPPQEPQTQARGDDFGGGDVQDGGSWS